jgi:hydrogenase expression/formation protein HypD
VAGPRVHLAERIEAAPEFAAFDAEMHYDIPGVRVADPKACQCGEVFESRDQALGMQGPSALRARPKLRSGLAWCRRRGRARRTTIFGRLHRDAAVALGRRAT